MSSRMSRLAYRLNGQWSERKSKSSKRTFTRFLLPIYGFDLRGSHSRELQPAAVISVSIGCVLV